ncbi:hypothetical protein [Lentibacillus salicampi]|uniref:Uncharacterized protein n=1 Tax=Lentibacillus salicampi TaxID=175306 RepID=A0A4Y9A7V4_9BACI|nr:hypothetical protein [Lentibacillus salicampi]TFJ91292.1 hypothetical protein E4U82_18540 [Lentibacillus salicampi]
MYVMAPVREAEVKEAVEKHLHDKYQQEFVIEDVSYQAEITEYKIKTYPAKNEKQDFIITVTEEQIINPEKEITDGYLYIYWDFQLEEEFKGIAEDIFEDQVEKVSADVSPRSLRQKYNGFYVKICKLASGTSDFQ